MCHFCSQSTGQNYLHGFNLFVRLGNAWAHMAYLLGTDFFATAADPLHQCLPVGWHPLSGFRNCSSSVLSQDGISESLGKLKISWLQGLSLEILSRWVCSGAGFEEHSWADHMDKGRLWVTHSAGTTPNIPEV